MVDFAKMRQTKLTPKLTPTPEQVEILGCQQGNLLINAYAGTGKSKTMELYLNAFVATTGQPCLYVAFNKAVVEEMTERQQLGELSRMVHIRTLNGVGHRVWGAGKRLDLNKDKVKDLFRVVQAEVPDAKAREALSDQYMFITKSVSMAKMLGYVPRYKASQFETCPTSLVTPEYFYAKLEEIPTELEIAVIEAILTLSIRQAFAGTIDFDDQIYMPTLFGGQFPNYPLVVVDEGQDLAPINHKMLQRLRPQRLVVVGDRNQSIYAFRGAVTSGLDRLKRTFEMAELPLSISFRCPSEIVKGVHWHVPNFRWSREGGLRTTIPRATPADLRVDAAIICRNNAPLFALAFRLIAARRSCEVMGSDIGPRVVNTLRRLCDPDTPSDQVLAKIDEWVVEKQKSSKAPKSLADMAECMRIFAGHGTTLAGAISYAERIFSERGSLKLLTGHKSKGLEFDTVYHIDGDLIDQTDEQDRNLRYVIDTRSKQELFLIDSKDIIDASVTQDVREHGRD